MSRRFFWKRTRRLNGWAENDKRWLWKLYSVGTGRPHFDLTPATEKALIRLKNLSEQDVIGMESLLLPLFEVLR
ncbi:MAG: hypothetical protein CSB23_00750 [Deltaproteobacteria bacterium]|nr:MAG: hypothetical protein CSB23_00750 [Deltaproteobacteria bacterium]